MGFLLHHSIDEAAARDPDRDAFRCDGEAIRYADLVSRAHCLAQALVEHGVRPHDRVGIYMNKSLDLPVAVYGTLAAGAAYVPIDPASPPARVEFILRDCGIRHLITDPMRSARVADVVAGLDGFRCVIGATRPERAADADRTAEGPAWIPWQNVQAAPARDPRVRVLEHDLAYVMYTSGSTGVPKGLMHTHASGLAYARLSRREYGVTAEDRLGNHSPLHFDMSTFEYLTGPLCGATSVLITEETTMFPVSLAELIERERLTFWYSVPLALIQLLDHGALEERDHRSLRWVLFGGESLSPKHLARLVELWPHARFSNSYGPAEVNQCTAFHVPSGPVDPDEPIPIGKVWDGAEGRVVDQDDRAVPRGTPGELLVRAPTMMLGYWAGPDLNRDAFFREAVAPGYEKVFYRTGDIVKERQDGNLVFLGRRDRLVKVRGHRVELDEVEAVLGALPGVAEAAAVDLRDDGRSVAIAAVVRPRTGCAPDSATLRRAASRRLSPYAVPSTIQVRDELPRTGSGKVDRTVLREELAEGI